MLLYIQTWLPLLTIALTAAICFSVTSFIMPLPKGPTRGSAATPRRHVRVCHGMARRPSQTTMALEAMPAKPMLNMPMMMPGNEWFT